MITRTNARVLWRVRIGYSSAAPGARLWLITIDLVMVTSPDSVYSVLCLPAGK